MEGAKLSEDRAAARRPTPVLDCTTTQRGEGGEERGEKERGDREERGGEERGERGEGERGG